MIWSGKVYSKCYFNPALTLCDFYLKNISLNKAIYVVVSQLIGAYIGSLFIYYTVPQILLNQAANEDAALGGVYFNVKYSFINGIIVEALLSFVLAIIYFTSIQCKDGLYNIGLFYAFSTICANSITEGALNFFRYLGPAMQSLQLGDIHIYFLGSFLGTFGGTVVFQQFYMNKKSNNNIL